MAAIHPIFRRDTVCGKELAMIIIGEKINGAIPSVAKAIEEKNADWIRDLARRQSACGADFIDVCSAADKDAETLAWLIGLVQEVCDTPISIDSPDAGAILQVIPCCKKPGLINSVSLKEDKIDTVFPAVADSDWQIVALLCDSSAVSDSAEERIAIFEKIMEKARTYGIAPHRLHIDPMVFSVSTKPDAFTGFEAVVRHIRAAYPDIHITSGLSNVSFGMPSRRTINQAFLTLARYAGMDSAIMDPTSPDMQGAIYAAELLMEEDAFGIGYISAYRDERFGAKRT